MSEIPTPSNEIPQDDLDGLTPEQNEIAERFLLDYPSDVLPLEQRSGSEEGITKFNEMLSVLREGHDIEELYANTDPMNPLRLSARDALGPIVAEMLRLKDETDISEDRYNEIYSNYREFSNGVGMVNSGQIRRDARPERSTLEGDLKADIQHISQPETSEE